MEQEKKAGVHLIDCRGLSRFMPLAISLLLLSPFLLNEILIRLFWSDIQPHSGRNRTGCWISSWSGGFQALEAIISYHRRSQGFCNTYPLFVSLPLIFGQRSALLSQSVEPMAVFPQSCSNYKAHEYWCPLLYSWRSEVFRLPIWALNPHQNLLFPFTPKRNLLRWWRRPQKHVPHWLLSIGSRTNLW